MKNSFYRSGATAVLAILVLSQLSQGLTIFRISSAMAATSGVALRYRISTWDDGSQYPGTKDSISGYGDGTPTAGMVDDTDGRAGGAHIYYSLFAVNTATDVQLQVNYEQSDGNGQCGGVGVHTVIAPKAGATPTSSTEINVVDDTDNRSGWCTTRYRLIQSSRTADQKKYRIVWDSHGWGDQAQCGSTERSGVSGWSNQDDPSWTWYRVDDTDNRGGGCTIRFWIESAPNERYAVPPYQCATACSATQTCYAGTCQAVTCSAASTILGFYSIAGTVDGTSGVWNHAMNITSYNGSTGSFTGEGYYVPNPGYTYTVTGTLNGSAVSIQIIYTGIGAGYTATINGTLDANGNISARYTTNANQTGIWTATKIRPSNCPVTPQCSDGIDNDGDGATDFPNDFSCTSADDNDETNTKSQCQDGIDNDSDGLIDFPQDSGCSSKQDNTESSGAQCSDGIDNTDPEDTLADYNDLGCYQNGIYNPNDNDETDAQSTPQCSDGIDNDGDGATDLNDFSCSGASDNDETNPKSACQDGIDNDADGKTDFPADAGCSSLQDNDEANAIVSLPKCSDGIDNDGDGRSDFFDAGCYPNNVFNPSAYNPNDTDESNAAVLCRWTRVNSQWVRSCM